MLRTIMASSQNYDADRVVEGVRCSGNDDGDDNDDDDGVDENNSNSPSEVEVPKPAKKRPRIAYLPHHQVNYGVAPYKYNADGTLQSVVCLFCQCFGREQKQNSKRKVTQKVGTFQHPFRCDKYVQHHSVCHKTRWDAYQRLEDQQKRTYFEDFRTDENAPYLAGGGSDTADDSTLFQGPSAVPRKRGRPPKIAVTAGNAMISGAIGTNNHPLRFRFDPDIVEILMGDLLWDPSDEPPPIPQQSHRPRVVTNKALSIFDCRENEETGNIYYVATIPQSQAYYSVIMYLSKPGISKETCAELLTESQHLINTGHLATMPGSLEATNVRHRLIAKVLRYSRFAVAQNLQCLQEILSSSWGYSLVVDKSNHERTGYIDIGVRVFTAAALESSVHDKHKHKSESSALRTFHILSFPSFSQPIFGGSKTSQSQIMLNLFSRVMHVLDIQWQEKAIAVLIKDDGFGRIQVHDGHTVIISHFIQLLKQQVAKEWHGSDDVTPPPPLFPVDLAQQWTEAEFSRLLQQYRVLLSLVSTNREDEDENENEEQEEMNDTDRTHQPMILQIQTQFELFYQEYHLESETDTENERGEPPPAPAWKTSLDTIVAETEMSTQRPTDSQWFKRTWKPLQEEFPHLFRFFAMLATSRIDPPDLGTASGIFRWTKPVSFQRGSEGESASVEGAKQDPRALIDFTLEAQLHCRQYEALQQCQPKTK